MESCSECRKSSHVSDAMLAETKRESAFVEAAKQWRNDKKAFAERVDRDIRVSLGL